MEQFLLVWLIFFGISPQGLLGTTWACKDMTSSTPLLQLKYYLFCNYDDEIRHIADHRNATDVDFRIVIEHFEVDDLANTVDFHVTTRLEWTDSHLTWDPSHFGGINAIQTLSSEIWVPDITLHSTTNQYIDTNIPTIPCMLLHQGSLLCVPMTMYTTYCESDHTWWPYTVMICSIEIASWSYNNDEIHVRPLNVRKEGRLTEKVQNNNSAWEIIEILFDKHVIDSKFDLGFSSDLLSYRVFLKRHSSMYGIIYITFAVVLMTMTLMALWLEPSSTERMVIANLNFVLHFISLQDLQWKTPSNGIHPPKLLSFYENSLILATFSLILTSVLRHVQQLKVDAPVWMSSTSVTILKSRIGQVFLMTILDPNVSAKMELHADDNTTLVTAAGKDYTWKYTSILIGWLAFLCVLFVYLIMFPLLIPTNTPSNSPLLNS